MQIFVNDEKLDIEAGSCIPHLLTLLNTPSKGIAIAINQEIVPQNIWDKHTLKEDDKVLLIRATQGG